MSTDYKIMNLIRRMTAACISYGWVTGDYPPPAPGRLLRMARMNPRGYAMLMEYKQLIDENGEGI